MPLRVRVVSVAGVQDEDDFGSNDLYVTLTTGGQTEKTTVKKGAGRQAIWDEAFVFPNWTPGSPIEIEVKDKDPLKDDKLGKVKITPEISGPGEKEVVAELHHGLLHKKRGVINLIVSAQ
ncbi:C2 domain-containing protein [Fimicolochytrium jonesii]|uniref:C2 domain-containing protein n=1 Tax=Fimicolochytrium jonesii TaxID=1396493 RepID=UPI0022FF2EA4|nr:C2 domain-containing protein [Fimicolochytrium jonesii]KAI8818243.1 C2 domain-containing protein [Fimicolochytrium jonesii]